ncbi:hypothetical protein ETB97_001540 [Aspergillus alliaceus]|uniref:Uncharacterized protein n=1 Tax=Petromyces alliaceus TaxID=209559 RepID=A0A5N6FN43_PETAA|nr:uncharacterized protein BDW43DRAFT_313172 [Aspergillus alliaceus]KAB8231361.1 hypothetical protein BDW43DRAFT_313172 [Aspergillus alliaceus]KAF5865963.1 hypothetical protein ETB97_001540 [Aspergillus burnettii]
MQFRSVITLLAAATAVTATPGGGESQCSPEQANKCCSGLTNGILNLNVLPALCLPLLADCNNQVACCESNGIGLLNCLTIQL